jgi:hypothetical protein
MSENSISHYRHVYSRTEISLSFQAVLKSAICGERFPSVQYRQIYLVESFSVNEYQRCAFIPTIESLKHQEFESLYKTLSELNRIQEFNRYWIGIYLITPLLRSNFSTPSGILFNYMFFFIIIVTRLKQPLHLCSPG